MVAALWEPTVQGQNQSSLEESWGKDWRLASPPVRVLRGVRATHFKPLPHGRHSALLCRCFFSRCFTYIILVRPPQP